MEIILALLFAACLAVYLIVAYFRDEVPVDDHLANKDETRVKGLTEIFSEKSSGTSIRETLSAIMGPTTYAVPGYMKPRPEKKPRNPEADLLRRCGLIGRFTKRQRKARKEQALRAGIPYYEIRRAVRG